MGESKNYERYKKYYNAGWYTEEMLENLVEKGKITKEECEEIVKGEK